jgi:hypothetical protein
VDPDILDYRGAGVYSPVGDDDRCIDDWRLMYHDDEIHNAHRVFTGSC